MGEQIAAVGDSHAQLAEDWEESSATATKAEKDIKAAKKAIKQAEKDLEQAHEDLEDANARLVEGKRGIAEAEAEFHRRFPGQSMSQ